MTLVIGEGVRPWTVTVTVIGTGGGNEDARDDDDDGGETDDDGILLWSRSCW